MPSKTQGRQRPSLKDTAQACSAQREWCSTGRSQRKRQKNGRGNDPPGRIGHTVSRQFAGRRVRTMRLPRIPTKRASQANRTGKGCSPAAGPAVSVALLAQGKRSAKTAEAVRKRSERGLEEAREPVGTRQDRTLLPVPDALRTTFRKRDVRAFERGGSAKGGSAKGAPAAKGFRQGSRLRRPPEQAYRGLAREDVRRSAQKKTGHEIWPRVCLKTGAQALLLLSGRHVCSPWHGYGPAFSATVTCSFFQMAFRHSPLFLSRGLED